MMVPSELDFTCVKLDDAEVDMTRERTPFFDPVLRDKFDALVQWSAMSGVSRPTQ